jgi:hypothetical protein
MEKLLVLYMILVVFACSGNHQKSRPQKKDTAVYYPYSPIFSELEPGKALQAKMVLEVWRAYETGNVLSSRKNFSDSLQLIFQDQIFQGRRDSILNLFQKRRAVYTDVQSYVDSWLPVHAKQTGDNLVLIWGRLDCTGKNGKRDYLVVHETWWFDASGRIREMDQYLTHPH